jgi:hypothetical protein
VDPAKLVEATVRPPDVLADPRARSVAVGTSLEYRVKRGVDTDLKPTG